MRVADLVAAMERIAPTSYAESWDNVGLLVGDPALELSRVMLAVDYSTAVADEATAARCQAVVAYHPPLFAPVKRVTAGSPAFDAIRRGLALYSPHTALDVAEGGTNDVLADLLGMTAREPLRRPKLEDRSVKLVTFVPEADVEPLSAALFAAGAGQIGRYRNCSFRTPGVGTFFGESGTNPVVGEAGRLEQAPEIRLETLVPLEAIDRVVRALRAAHPYEEPAFDLVRLAPLPEHLGLGRIGAVAPRSRAETIAVIKHALGLEGVLVAGPREGTVTRAAVCAGSCGDLVHDAAARGAQLVLTGEMRHHDALRAARDGVTVVCVLHSNSERCALGALGARLERELPGLEVRLSVSDHDPFVIC